jgi:flagellar motor switch protein FliM
MGDQILSQEEIDALLSAMDKGEVNPEQMKKAEVVVEPYSLTSQNLMLSNQFCALEEVYDKFATSLQTYLSSSLNQPAEVEFVSAEMTKYDEFISTFPSPTSLHIFNMEPLIGAALLAIEANLVFALIDCMLGGSGVPLDPVRDFTLIEQRMIKKFALKALETFEQTWESIHPVKVYLRRTETNPEFVHLVNSNELMFIVVFSIKGNDFSGNVHICIPYIMLEPIKDELSSAYRKEEELEHSWSTQLQGLLMDTQVNIVAELGKTTYTVEDLLNLQVDDVVQLDTGPQDPIMLKVGGIPKYQGFPGIINGNRAVEITKLLHKTGGEK